MHTRVFSTQELINALDITPRRFQWWHERGVLVPKHVAHHRRGYSTDQAVVAGIIGQLSARGMSIQSIRKILIDLFKAVRRCSRYVVVVKSVVATSDNSVDVIKQVCILNEKYRAGCILVDIAEIENRLDSLAVAA